MSAVPDRYPTVGRDARLVGRAVELAMENARDAQLPFGALVVRHDDVLGSGVNTALRDHDPLAHAEVEAVRAACRQEGTLELEDAVLYSSCEPCPLCRTAALTAGIRRVVYAAPRGLVPDLVGTPTGLDLAALDRIRVVFDTAGALDLVHVPVAGASGPFDAYLERRTDG